MEQTRYPKHMVFGLDIGTRSIVGTVGYRENDHNFTVAAICVKEHDTRAMLDGQIHDIGKVSESIAFIKKELEKELDVTLTDVCIAAAGRVLKTITVRADYEFQTETYVTDVHIHSLDLLAVEKAYDNIREEMQKENIDFYCVAYTPVHYYLNDYPILKLDDHKANKISVELLATFLPEEVIDGLYSAVEKAGLQVANLTLEPIAAINIAIPEKFRMLNIALVDVGAGTSDISITRDGSIIAYGMIPYAGDELTEAIMQKFLVEFSVAEKIKLACLKKKTVTYKDIMGISHKTSIEEVKEALQDTVSFITKNIADKIIELNGGKTVSAVFVVGGGGKIPGFVETLAHNLELSKERVALRGEEVLREVHFLPEKIKKDPLLVTPIGICLNYYEQKNNFIFVNVNGERIKLYDNNKLTIVDAAIQFGFPNEKLFPRRGKAIQYTVNGQTRMTRGELGEAAVVKLNGKETGINTPIVQNDKIEILESTTGKDAEIFISQLPEYQSTIEFQFNNKKIICPKFVVANQNLKSEYYSICHGDCIEILNYYTLGQILEFMDLPYQEDIKVNNVYASVDDKVYENFSIAYGNINEMSFRDLNVESLDTALIEDNVEQTSFNRENTTMGAVETSYHTNTTQTTNKEIHILVNGQRITLKGKDKYIFVDILDYYEFDMTVARGTSLVLKVNQQSAEFSSSIENEDVIDIYWEE
ncbi:cell division protein FtsA [Anaerosporobacter mobilis DSM 15930]|uniref:Cell division protein FtsA n=1 Tax=Anaerosporobacter mobilis DSM 15930 TaxID=1120996 RepID=A0A1M7GYT7_9FIRM|nr:pilus assembly protein PilM [Anaerosporobacter mobilis]SHM21445.1 cell division protein FtsA [Anaerosporobacter mobilis DSM 15930]